MVLKTRFPLEKAIRQQRPPFAIALYSTITPQGRPLHTPEKFDSEFLRKIGRTETVHLTADVRSSLNFCNLLVTKRG